MKVYFKIWSCLMRILMLVSMLLGADLFAETLTIPVARGWNLLSNPTTAPLPVADLGSFTTIYVYDGDGWSSEATQVGAGQAFWLRSDEAEHNLSVEGDPYDPTPDVHAAGYDTWHLYGTGTKLIVPGMTTPVDTPLDLPARRLGQEPGDGCFRRGAVDQEKPV